jgi:hypothetical protein
VTFETFRSSTGLDRRLRDPHADQDAQDDQRAARQVPPGERLAQQDH